MNRIQANEFDTGVSGNFDVLTCTLMLRFKLNEIQKIVETYNIIDS